MAALDTVVLVPRREGFPDRDALWAWCRSWWEEQFPDWPIFEGHHDVGLFNRSAAVNTAARLAGDWRTAVIIDADVIGDPATIRRAVDVAHEQRRMVLPYEMRKDISKAGTQRVTDGFRGNWDRYVYRRWPDTVSSIVVVSRSLWDATRGFDEAFQGWGCEDDAFMLACQTLGDGPLVRLPGEVWHLHHATSKDGRKGSPSYDLNDARRQRYRVLAALGDRQGMLSLRDEAPIVVEQPGGIPRVIHRVVPEKENEQAEKWFAAFGRLHPGWRLVTHRDPLDPAAYPMTSRYWPLVKAGAQLADLVRLEVLYVHGGVYVDQDVEPYRSLEPLVPLEAFAAWEDRNSVPNAVMGARPGHPAIKACLDEAIARLKRGRSIWDVGPGVLTTILPGRQDVLLLPPGSFYPYHYKEKERAEEDHKRQQPWAFAAHHWWGSWLKQ